MPERLPLLLRIYERFAVQRISNHKEWTKERIRQKAVNKKWEKLDGTIMFPTTHDIVDENIDCAIEVLRKMLQVGNNVLIAVSRR
jgi:hypothetical protein